MATEKVYKPYLGAGQVYARAENDAAALAPIGNVSELKLSIEEESKTLQDYTRGGGGTYAEVRRIQGVSISATLHDMNRENLSRALYGEAGEAAAGSASDEVHTAYKGGLIRLAHINPSAVTVTSEDGATTYAADTDFEVRSEGVFILDAGAIADGDKIKVNYTYPAYDIVEALTRSGVILEMSFGGVNEADSGKPVVVDLFRVSLGAAKDVSLIGDDFASLQLEGKLLVDQSKTGAGISRYMKVSMA